MPDEKVVILGEREEGHIGKDNVDVAEEMHIPDCTMVGFGLPEGPRTGGKPRLQPARFSP